MPGVIDIFRVLWRQFFPHPPAPYTPPPMASTNVEPPYGWWEGKYERVLSGEPSSEYVLVLLAEWPPHDEFAAAVSAGERVHAGIVVRHELTRAMSPSEAFGYAEVKAKRDGYSKVVFWEDPRMVYGPDWDSDPKYLNFVAAYRSNHV